MKKKINELLNVLAGAVAGVTVATVLTRWADYRKYPALFEGDSAPWWTGILIPAILGAVVLVLVIAAKLALRRKKD